MPKPKRKKNDQPTEPLKDWTAEEQERVLELLVGAFGRIGLRTEDGWLWRGSGKDETTTHLPKELVAVKARYKMFGGTRKVWAARIVRSSGDGQKMAKAAMAHGADKVEVWRATITWEQVT